MSTFLYSYAQRIEDCGTPYQLDLSVGYTIAGIGNPGCGCVGEPKAQNCELIRISLSSERSGVTTTYDCDEIIVSERWWRELKDLIDFFDPITCLEYPESDIYPDLYTIPTTNVSPGGTLDLLMCITPDGENSKGFIASLSAQPGTNCHTYCIPEISCPATAEIHKNEDCLYIITDFTSATILTDTCMTGVNLEERYVLTQIPPPGSIITEDLFVEIQVLDTLGVVITTCDVSVELIGDEGFIPPIELPDIQLGDDLPEIPEIYLCDTTALGDIIKTPIEGEIEYEEDACAGYTVTYRWRLSSLCAEDSIITTSFSVIANDDPPIFVSIPNDIKDIHLGEKLPYQVDLLASNALGDTTGVKIIKSIDSSYVDHCAGYDITYRWTAIDTCGREAFVERAFQIIPQLQPPVFIDTPSINVNSFVGEPLPIFEKIKAVAENGDTLYAKDLLFSIDDYIENVCDGYQIRYNWIATDACGLTSTFQYTFDVLPNPMLGFATLELADQFIEIDENCKALTEISIPNQLVNSLEIDIAILDDHLNLVENVTYADSLKYFFNLGTSYIVYSITDSCGFSNQDTVIVNVKDATKPTFTCVENISFLISEPSACELEAVWAEPAIVDNCQLASYTQIAGPKSGDILAVGKYPVIYEAIDKSGNRSTCEFLVEVSHVNTQNLACQAINLTVDDQCLALLTPEVVYALEEGACLPNFTLEIVTNDQVLAGGIIDLSDYLGQTLDYRICNIITGDCCSNTVHVEDKKGPVLICQDTFVYCWQDWKSIRPIVISECTDFTWDITEVPIADDCTSGYLSFEKRIFVAKDRFGNESAPCEVNFKIISLNIDSLQKNKLLLWPKDTTLLCDGLSTPIIADHTYGEPSFFGSSISLLKIQDLCNLDVSFSDDVIYDESCRKFIRRTWSIIEWSCNDWTETKHVQNIRVEDHQAPSISFKDDSLTIGTVAFICGYNLTIPFPILSDNCQDATTLWTRVSVAGKSYNPGDVVTLSVGHHLLTYEVRDDCGNGDRATLYVEVIDKIAPVAICFADIVVSLSAENQKVYATSINDNSHDDCALSSVLLKRATNTCEKNDSTFREFIHLCCEDVGDTLAVWLQVTDEAGNKNSCDANIIIQDKEAPEISCPSDLVVDCSYPRVLSHDLNDPYRDLYGGMDHAVLPMSVDISSVLDSFGPLMNGVVYDLCDNASVSVITEEELNSCGLGKISRHFQATDQAGNISAPCTQTIYVRKAYQIVDTMVSWPDSLIIIDGCFDEYDVNEAFGQPKWTDKSCALLASSYQDLYASTTGLSSENTCAVLIRRWSIIDWCDPDLNPLLYTQKIKFADDQLPEITIVREAPIYYTPDYDCSNAQIEIVLAGNDNCVAPAYLTWSAELDYYHNGSFGPVDPNQLLRDGSSIRFIGLMPLGEHTIRWRLEDPCGNAQTLTQTFTVVDTIAPVAYGANVSTAIESDGTVQLWATDIDQGSYHKCYEDVDILIAREGEPIQEAKSALRFTCEDIGVLPIWLYAYRVDALGVLRYSHASILVQIRDDQDICEINTVTTAKINVAVSDMMYNPMSDVSLSLFADASLLEEKMSTVEGATFDQLKKGAPYRLKAHYDGPILDGISTRDIILIQNHLLGLNIIEDMPRQIAADINKDGKVSTTDILDLRRVLIGIKDQFSNNNSWRSITDMTPSDRTDTLEDFYHIPILNSDMEISFTTIKIGDVDQSYTPNAHAVSRSIKSKRIIVEDYSYRQNETFTSSISVESIKANGLQLEWKYDPQSLQLIDLHSDLKGWGAEHWFHDREQGIIRISWSTIREIQLHELLTFKFIGLREGRLSEGLQLIEQRFPSLLFNQIGDFPTELVVLPSQKSQADLIVYPNPFKSDITISIPALITDNYYVEIWNMQGQLIYKKEYQHSEREINISTATINNGKYILKITNPLKSYYTTIVKME